jgi:hypothetical protein
MLPLLYGEHDEDVNNAAVNLLWISRGLVPTVRSSLIPDEALDSKEFEDVKLSMWTIIHPLLFGN